MDPKPPPGMLFAPPASGGAVAVRLPGRASWPALDDHLVTPEVTRDEMIRGRLVRVMPASPPHADRHFGLSYVIGAYLEPGYIGASELLTRLSEGSDFATDVCVRKAGKHPVTGERHLEELVFEVVNEQSMRDISEKAEDLTTRGVRRFIAVFVKTGKVCQWMRDKRAFVDLEMEEEIEDLCLHRPLRVRALLDAVEADDAVARVLVEKGNPVIEAVKGEGVVDGKSAAVLAVLAARGLAVSLLMRARLAACRDGALLDRWISRAAVVNGAEEVFVRE